MALRSWPVCAYLESGCDLYITDRKKKELKKLPQGDSITIRCINPDHLNIVERVNIVERISQGYVSYTNGLKPLDMSRDTLERLVQRIQSGSHYFISKEGELLIVEKLGMIEHPNGKNLLSLVDEAEKARQKTIDSYRKEHIEIGEARYAAAKRVRNNPFVEHVLDWLEELGIQALDPITKKRWRELL